MVHGRWESWGPWGRRLGEAHASPESLPSYIESPLPSRVTMGVLTLEWSEVGCWPPSKTLEGYPSKGPHRASQMSLGPPSSPSIPPPRPLSSPSTPNPLGRKEQAFLVIFLCQIIHQTQSSKPLCELSPPRLVLRVQKLRNKGI